MLNCYLKHLKPYRNKQIQINNNAMLRRPEWALFLSYDCNLFMKGTFVRQILRMVLLLLFFIDNRVRQLKFGFKFRGDVHMPELPAVCDNCNAIFRSGIVIDGSTATLNKNRVRCPKCSGIGSVSEGVFNFIGNTIEILSAPERTISELQRFNEILQSAKNKSVSFKQVEDRVYQETPQFVPVLESMPKIKKEKSADFHVWIQTLAAITSLVMPWFEKEKPSPPKIEINQVINHIYESDDFNNEPIKTKKIGRNELCPCGSGLKYKFCHLESK
ncbi:Preprotein translocase subunit SecA [Bacillus velezensis]|nr:Preprotein translocase subunit SecA [Bacillus velezensis]